MNNRLFFQGYYFMRIYVVVYSAGIIEDQQKSKGNVESNEG